MKIHELEKGKWYRYYHLFHDGNTRIWYFMFDNFTHNPDGYIPYTINLKKDYYILNKDYIRFDSNENYNWTIKFKDNMFEEINFAKIAKYLPNDHIDKKIYYRKKKIKTLLK